ncbi:MAG: hypothetical protein Q8P40_07620, partial [Nitrospirota bacterium]|nr:hypothetical protein [Nitrospirota bacterium]
PFFRISEIASLPPGFNTLNASWNTAFFSPLQPPPPPFLRGNPGDLATLVTLCQDSDAVVL